MTFSRVHTSFDYVVSPAGAARCGRHDLTPSSTLGITSWTRLDHGGHSFLFRVTIPGSPPSVLKIFRFTPLPQHTPLTTGSPHSLSPYLYFLREAGAYAAFSTVPVGPSPAPQDSDPAPSPPPSPVPRLLGFIRIDAEHESHLANARLLKGFVPGSQRTYFRKREAEMPLVAVWIEWIPGRRMTREDMAVPGRRAEVERALGWCHDAGVVQGDVNWRNVLIVEGEAGDDNDEEVGEGSSGGTSTEGGADTEAGDEGGGGGEAECAVQRDARRGEGRVVFIDFSNASVRREVDKDDTWCAEVAKEKARLKRMFDGRERIPAPSNS